MEHKELAEKLLKLNICYAGSAHKKNVRTVLYDEISKRIIAYLYHGKWLVTYDIKELKTQAFDVIKLLDEFNEDK